MLPRAWRWCAVAILLGGFAASGCGGASGEPSGPGTGGTPSGGRGSGGASATGGSATGGDKASGGATGGAPPSSTGGQGQGGSRTGGNQGGAAGSSATGGARGGAGAGGSTGGAGGASGGTHNPLTSAMIQGYVDAHNKARAGQIVTLDPAPNPALPPVTWDPILADSAYLYTTKCVGDGNLLSHNANRTADYQALGGKDTYVGENIYASTGDAIDPLAVVKAWVDEIKSYTYGPITNDTVSAAGHYTQVVWRDSVRIGCAVYNCPSQKFHTTVLCDYAPGGNILKSKPY